MIAPKNIATVLAFVFSFCLAVSLPTSAASGTAKAGRRIPNGIWGGTGIRMTVENDGATIEYDCGGGSIDGPLALNRRGGFDLKGKHARGHGGPIRLGEPSNEQTARYTGKVSGKVMNLTVKLANSNEAMATYTLRQGVEPRLHRCL
ncbi:MAG: hypothetical protein WCD76_19400 [Pyrinomonadaceae bacterium]